MGAAWGLSQDILHGHDLRFVALAIGVCALGSLTATAIAQHALKSAIASLRFSWLALAGFVTGITVWTTHFSAMLGYRTDLDIRFNLLSAGFAVAMAIGISISGLIVGFSARNRGALAGAIIGVGIAVAHFIDMYSLRVAGLIEHNHIICLAAISSGVALTALSGLLFARWKAKLFAWPAACALFGGIVSLHFLAMSGVSMSPDGSPLVPPIWSATSHDLMALVTVGFLFLLSAAGALTWHSASLASATAREQRSLDDALYALQESQENHCAYVELSRQIGWVANAKGELTEIARLWAELVGLSREDGFGDGWAQAIHPDDAQGVMAYWKKAVATGDDKLTDGKYRIRLADGSFRWFRARAQPRRDDQGAIVAWYGSLEDIDGQVVAENALRVSEERYRFASRAANDVIWDWSVEDQRATWAGAYEKVLGYPELEQTTDLAWWVDRIHPEDFPKVLESQQEAEDSARDSWSGEYRFRVATGKWIVVKSSCFFVRDDSGKVVRIVGSMLDITEQKTAQDELSWAAYHDNLTGLPNRARYLASIAAAISEARQADRFVALVLLDLNRFKELNDSLGHAAGDQVLQTIASRLSAGVPDGATVARLGGDEFAIILPDLTEAEAFRPLVERLLRSLGDPVAFEAMRIPIGFCAGVAISPRDGNDPGQLLIAADLALYAAKGELLGGFQEFHPSLKAEADRRTQMLALARRALDEDAIVPFYQPKIDLQTGEIIGWEALLRIRGEGDAILHPAAIEAAFADADLSVWITDRMFALVFADLARWHASGCNPGRIAINVSAGDFRQRRLSERLQFHASVHGRNVEQIDIEVTENVLIGRLGADVLLMLEDLQARGVRIVLDDFGTGYASLTHLQRFPVDVIKLDRSFIESINESDGKATAVIDAVLQMARLMDIKTVAEGIETADQARYLRARGCTSGQGYLFSHAVAFAEVQQLMNDQPPEHWQFAAPFAANTLRRFVSTKRTMRRADRLNISSN